MPPCPEGESLLCRFKFRDAGEGEQSWGTVWLDRFAWLCGLRQSMHGW